MAESQTELRGQITTAVVVGGRSIQVTH